MHKTRMHPRRPLRPRSEFRRRSRGRGYDVQGIVDPDRVNVVQPRIKKTGRGR
jgi:hypothetical protein